jgi:hypothetical protein
VFLHWAFHSSKCPPTHQWFSLLLLVFAIVVNWVLLSVLAIVLNWVLLLVLAIVVNWVSLMVFAIVCQIFGQTQRSINSWVLLTFMDNFYYYRQHE